MMTRMLLALLITFLAPVPLQAQFPKLGLSAVLAEEEPSLIEVEAKASVESYQKGKSFYLAYTLDCENPWHAYYRNPATVGLPMSVSMKPVEGFELEGPYWSIPTREKGETGVSYSYHQAHFVWMVTPKDDAPAEATFTINSTAQLCRDTGCAAPEDSSASLSLSEGDAATNPKWGGWESQVESLGDTRIEVAAKKAEGGVQLVIQAPAAIDSAYFFSEDNGIAPQQEQVLTALPEQGEFVYSLFLPYNDGKDGMYPAPKERAAQLKGLLRFGNQHSLIDQPIEDAITAPSGDAETAAASGLAAFPAEFWAIVLSLFLGGFILNFMPCVFPVIGLKIMGFVQLAGGSRRKIFLHSLAFVLGILISFWVLSFLLIVLSKIDLLASQSITQWFGSLWSDTGSNERSWAVWMENPWVVYVLALILLVLGLSMYGLFEIGVSATGAGQGLQQKKGYVGSFFSGLLATLVATPCTGPFLGPILPAAMALPALWMMAAMSFMALGLALPYVLMGIFPSMLKILPKPGAWMESLKQGLSFLILAAVAWLVYVYLAFVPDYAQSSIMWILVGFVMIACACWVYGRWCSMYRSKLSRCLGLLAALALVGGAVYKGSPLSFENQLRWETWSPELMQKSLEEGKPVYVDFTATWCMTCIANKQVAYTEDVLAVMRDHDVVLMRADKTTPNAEIDAQLRELGRSSVPVNVLFMPDAAPAITREILTPDYMLEFLQKHLKKK